MKDFYVLVDQGECFRTGKVIENVGADYFMVQFDDMNGSGRVLPAELFHLDEMASTVVDGIKVWSFFQSAEALQAWIAHIDSPDQDRPMLRVVNLHQGVPRKQ